MAEIVKINENTWSFEDGHVRFFLLAGTKEALLVDSGMFTPDVKKTAQTLTDLPIKLINTHSDRDHVGGNGDFDIFYMHPEEADHYYSVNETPEKFIPVEEGTVLDLGDREIKVIHVPGHTPGSIALLDVKNRALFGGDSVQDGSIYMFGGHRDPMRYIEGMKHLQTYTGGFDVVYASHSTLCIDPCMVKKLTEAMKDALLDIYPFTLQEMHGTPIRCVDAGIAKFLMPLAPLSEKFEFRDIREEETEQAVNIEQICFPPNEACSPEHMTKRIKKAPELFLVAIDKETGRVAGFLNGLATKEETFRDEFFLDETLQDPDGGQVMLLGLDVLPEYRGQGLAAEIVKRYMLRESKNGRSKLVLTCLDQKVGMYEKWGFTDNGLADSTWGGEEWHEMIINIP